MEETQKVADQLVFWQQLGDLGMVTKYLKNIRKVTRKDIKRVIDKYFKHYTQVIIEGKS